MTAISNLVHQSATTSGTGNFTLAAVNGKQTFNSAFGTGGTDVFYYFISNRGAVAEWEVGTGHLLDATTLVRDTVLASSNAGAAVNFSAGQKDVTNAIPAVSLPVALGGTGRASHTAYAVLCGGTAASAAQQSIAGVGTSGQVLTSNGASALPTFQNQLWRPIAEGSVSAASTLDFTSLGTYDVIEIDLINILPVTDTDILFARLSQSAAFLSGASDYSWGLFVPAAVNDTADSEIDMTIDVGNAGTESGFTGTVRLHRPTVSAARKGIHWWGGFGRATDGQRRAVAGFGQLVANTDAVDGIQFLFSTGNIASGYYAIRGGVYT